MTISAINHNGIDTKLFGDFVEKELREEGVPYEIEPRVINSEDTKVLRKRYGLSETAKVDLISDSCVVLKYGHLERPDWLGHTVLNNVFSGERVCIRLRDSHSDRRFVVDGKFVGAAIDCIGGGRCVMFLPDLSFILVDHFSYLILYDGERNDFYTRADQLIREFYKKPGN